MGIQVRRLAACAFTAAAVFYCKAAVAADPPTVPAPELKAGDTWILQETAERGPTGFKRSREEHTVVRVNSDTVVVGLKVEGARDGRAAADHGPGLEPEAGRGRRPEDHGETVVLPAQDRGELDRGLDRPPPPGQSGERP